VGDDIRHRAAGKGVLQRNKDLQDIIASWASTSFPTTQAGGVGAQTATLPFAAFHVAEQFTGMQGKYVKLEDTIKGFKEIVDGKHDEIPEQGSGCRDHRGRAGARRAVEAAS